MAMVNVEFANNQIGQAGNQTYIRLQSMPKHYDADNTKASDTREQSVDNSIQARAKSRGQASSSMQDERPKTELGRIVEDWTDQMQ